MLAQRLRRWPNIKPTLFQCVGFAGHMSVAVICLYVDFVVGRLVIPDPGSQRAYINTLIVLTLVTRWGGGGGIGRVMIFFLGSCYH